MRGCLRRIELGEGLAWEEMGGTTGEAAWLASDLELETR